VGSIMERGEVANWDAFETMIGVIYKGLNKKPEDQSMLFTTHPFVSKANASKSTQFVFETFNIPAYYTGVKPVLNLYSSGHTTGLAVALGHDLMSWMPIYEAHSVSSASGASPLAGGMVTGRLLEVLQESNPFLSENDLEDISTIQEKFCYVAKNYELETQLGIAEEKSFKLKNGTEINLKNERFRGPEVLFKPNLVGLDVEGIHHLLADAILSSPMDMRKDLQNNICIGGNFSKIPGISERISRELAEIDIEVFENCKIRLSAADSIWIGASILASLSTMSTLWITREEYDESGPAIVFRKCPL